MNVFDIILLLFGTFLSAFIGWIISYETSRKKRDGILELTGEANTIVDQKLIYCWQQVTNPENMKYFTIAHWGAFEDEGTEIKQGTRIKRISYMGSESWCYVVTYDKPYRFAWGISMYEWNNFIELKEYGNQTQIFLRRKFYPSIPNWKEYLIEQILNLSRKTKEKENHHYLTKESLKGIARVCS